MEENKIEELKNRITELEQMNLLNSIDKLYKKEKYSDIFMFVEGVATSLIIVTTLVLIAPESISSISPVIIGSASGILAGIKSICIVGPKRRKKLKEFIVLNREKNSLEYELQNIQEKTVERNSIQINEESNTDTYEVPEHEYDESYYANPEEQIRSGYPRVRK